MVGTAQERLCPPLRLFECTLKAVAFTPSIGMIASVKRAQKGPLRDVLARNMRKLRAAHGLSQEALAHELLRAFDIGGTGNGRGREGH